MSTTALKTIQHRIAGRETPGASRRTAPIWEPASGEQQAEVLLAEREDVDDAVQAARAAFDTWGDVSLTRRARVMFAFRNLVERHLDEIARIVSSEHGKVLDDAKGEVIRGLEVVEYACGVPQLLKGEYSDQVSTDIDAFSFRQPLGVCAGITPFNFPAMVPMWMHPMAIACGNTFVLKHPARCSRGCHRRDGRHQHPDPGPDGLLLVRRVEGLAVRRPSRPRPRRGPVLNPRQGGHQPLARGGAGPGPSRRAHALPDGGVR